jgi:hypothetical protein
VYNRESGEQVNYMVALVEADRLEIIKKRIDLLMKAVMHGVKEDVVRIEMISKLVELRELLDGKDPSDNG